MQSLKVETDSKNKLIKLTEIMKATIKLKEITKLKLGTDLAKLTLTLESRITGYKSNFSLESTGISLAVTGENHTKDLILHGFFLKLKTHKEVGHFHKCEGQLRLNTQISHTINKILYKTICSMHI